MATIKDVAEYANVSIGTVSKYINGIKIRKDNEARIVAAIEALHYRVNAAARTMKTSQTMLIAIIMSDLASNYFPKLVKLMEQKLYEHGYNVFVMDSDHNPDLERRKIELALEKNADGFIVCPLSGSTSNYSYILSQKKPLCIVDQYLSDLPACQIVSDNVGSVYQAVTRLLNTGHRHIGIITGEPTNMTAAERLRGYLLAYESFGLKPDPQLIHQTGFNEQDGSLAMERFAALPSPPTACIACNYYTLQGAFRQARSLGLQIPTDLTLLGFDHTMLPILSGLPIPIIEQRIDRIASVTVECLLSQLRGENRADQLVHRIETDCSALDILPL